MATLMEGELLNLVGISNYIQIILENRAKTPNYEGVHTFAIWTARTFVPSIVCTIAISPKVSVAIMHNHADFSQQLAMCYPKANPAEVSIMIPRGENIVVISAEQLTKKYYSYAINVKDILDEQVANIFACFHSFVQYETGALVNKVWTPTNVNKQHLST